MQRSQERAKTDVEAMKNSVLSSLWHIVTCSSEKIDKVDGYFCIRDYRYDLFAVLCKDNKTQKITVITLGKLGTIFPRNRDLVFQIQINNEIVVLNWKYIPKKEKS